MKKIVLTGGGTAGHVTPNLAIIPRLRQLGYEIYYIGSYNGIEKRLIADYPDIEYFGVSTGKFRRYYDLKNISDPFRVVKGFAEAKKILKKIKPDVVFSKGGFVSVPVVRAASALKIPCIIHESDITPGLANKICIPVAKRICCNFPETRDKLPKNKAVLTGSPIREELLKGDRAKGLEICNFQEEKPVVMIIGGSQGASAINDCVRATLTKLLEKYNIIHICGKEKMDNMLINTVGYKQFEYVKEDLTHLFAAADLVVSRAGANAICELLELKKPNLLIPLPIAGSRGDQLLNAESFEAQGFSMVLKEEYLDEDTLYENVNELFDNRQKYIDAMSSSSQFDSISHVCQLIEEVYNEAKIKR